MSSDKRKVVYPQEGKDYEDTVLDFLDKEISASAKPVPDQNAQQDEVDVLVSDLLKLAMAVTDEQEIPQESKAEDLDSLFADILNSRDEAPQTNSQSVFPERNPKSGPALKDSGPADQGSARHRVVERGPRQEAAVLPRAMDHPVASSPSPCLSPPSAAQVSLKALTDPYPGFEASQTAPVRDSTPIVMVAPPGPARRGRTLIASAGLACLLGIIGAGAYYFTGSKNSASNQSGKPASVPAHVAPVTTSVVTPKPSLPDPETRAKASPAQPSNPAAERSAPMAFQSRAKPGGPEPAPAKEVKAATAKPLEPLPKSTPVAEGAAPVDSTDRGISPVATGAENSTPNLQPHPPENEPPPATIITQPSQASILGRPAPAALPTLESVAPSSKSAAQPPASRKVIPAVLISQVRPVYPEAARRMRLTGTVRIDIQIDEQGRVVKATPVSGPPLLQSAAVAAVLKWRYKPATVGDVEIRSQGQVSIVFNNP